MSSPKFDQINMVPFIDIVLVLLAIVMTTASFVSQGLIEVDLPDSDASSQSQPQDNKSIEIAIDENNQIYYDGNKIVIEELKSKLQQAGKETAFYLRIDKEAEFEYFIKVFESMKVLDLENISIQTQVNE